MPRAAATETSRCPICDAVAAKGAGAFPFCSERCRLVDLGRWLDGAYRVPTLDDGPSSPDEEGDGDPRPS